MRILVTAGNTQTPIDRVRCITNIFTGRTGARLALEAHARGHAVDFVTSHPKVIAEIEPSHSPSANRWSVHTYRTFDELHQLMAQYIPKNNYDIIIHSAAISDYALGGVYAPAPGSEFPNLIDISAGKVKSSFAEVWLRLVPTPKLVDQIRAPWGFAGTLVKFKLEVDKTEAELVEIARRSRAASDADFLVANTLESYETAAIICNRRDEIEHVDRADLPKVLWDRLESGK